MNKANVRVHYNSTFVIEDQTKPNAKLESYKVVDHSTAQHRLVINGLCYLYQTVLLWETVGWGRSHLPVFTIFTLYWYDLYPPYLCCLYIRTSPFLFFLCQ